MRPSHLRPNCKADKRIFLWKGLNKPPLSTIDHPTICLIEETASRASLRDTGSYGSGIRKFHVFCDIFSIRETDRLPTSFEVLHSFALWVVTDPDTLDTNQSGQTPFEPVSVSTARKYLAAVRAWHITQGWPAPLSDDQMTRINWSLRGLANLQGNRRRKPLRPPVTIPMLRHLKRSLDLSFPFDACIWAIASSAFWGMMRFGEVTVKSQKGFDGLKHLKRRDAFIQKDLNGKDYARLDLPAAKTAKNGEIQSVFFTIEEDICPIEAIRNLSRVVPAGPNDPLFSWRDTKGKLRPMVKSKALNRINAIFNNNNWGTTFGHSFRIGGASFYLSQGVEAEIVRIAGRWKSLAYETYIRSFELVVSRHMANLTQNLPPPASA
ncbi:hypothetical protein M422DRAFT_190861 [Sphaerobolus stellatus SS14]|uniref:Tyr recombinase domain-containing protein n=1 Tax=Sphaerobolus stellatus (strain SS14) TaxID=990650 RepID=A0A0C9UQ55_SPHS4|nr:hypothetical protein M422DRAFT_190861 [Sphaerobolus stellatus SS14]